MDKVNHGPCKICGGPILYLGSNFCGPKCNNIALQPGSTADVRKPISRPNFAPTLVSLPESEPEPTKLENLGSDSVIIPELEIVPLTPEETPEVVVEAVVLPEMPEPPKKPKPSKKPESMPLESVPPLELRESTSKKLYL